MALDIKTISAVADELNARLVDTRIDKITQPHKDIVIITLRGRDTNALKLLISVNVSDMRVHLTEHSFDNPASPPMFCMLLRKHLINARVAAIRQPPDERIIDIAFKTSSVLGDAEEKRLLIELFGRIPNIILIGGDGIIIDCLRRISGDGDGKRMILPGLKYKMPEKQPGNSAPVSTLPAITGSISKMLDETFTIKTKSEGMKARNASLLKAVKTTKKRIMRKLEAQRTELEQSSKREYYKECGDIIMANMHLIKKGDTVLIADDFYSADSTGSKREIPLDPLRTPQKNAAKYYKKYTKAKNAEIHLTGQIAGGERELDYLESVIEQITRAESDQDVDDIREELVQTKYLKSTYATEKKAKKPKKPESKPIQLKTADGHIVLVGRNNVQNDKLTFKIASRFDTWFHTQKIHGAHVILRNGGVAVDDNTLRETANIAAYYSAARDAGKVPVDYTLVKYVKKPSGARPGMVIYTDYKTIQGDGRLVSQKEGS